eukprot:5111858-Karenia_brevis.AAC.1
MIYTDNLPWVRHCQMLSIRTRKVSTRLLTLLASLPDHDFVDVVDVSSHFCKLAPCCRCSGSNREVALEISTVSMYPVTE